MGKKHIFETDYCKPVPQNFALAFPIPMDLALR